VIDLKLLKLCSNSKMDLFLCVLAQCLSMFCTLAVTGCFCLVLEEGIKGLPISFGYLWMILFAVLLRFWMTMVISHTRSSIGAKVKKDLRERLYDKLLLLGQRSIDNLSMGGLSQLALEGIEQLDLYFATYLPQLFYALIAPVLLFLIYMQIDLRTALILLCCVFLIPAAIIGVSKYAKRIFAVYWDQYTGMGDSFLDNVQGLTLLKIFQSDKSQHEKMNQKALEFRRITMKVLVMQLASVTIMDAVAYGGAGAAIISALITALQGWISPIQALFLLLGASEFFLPMRALGSAFHIANNGATAGRKILALLDLPVQKWGSDTIDEVTEITMEHIKFGYQSDTPVLSDVSLQFKRGEMYAIVGESGSGKSTLMHLLSGFYRPQSGRILFKNQQQSADIYDLQAENFHQHLALVSSTTHLFADSVKANFLMANPQVSDAQIWQALESVQLAEHFKDNGGLDFVLHEDASNLSGGQKQRLALATVLSKPRDIYLFDEVTNNIDQASEEIIMKRITSLKAKAIVILITHRLYNLQGADWITVIENNRIKEQGTLNQLVKQNGLYARYLKAQKALLLEGTKEAV